MHVLSPFLFIPIYCSCSVIKINIKICCVIQGSLLMTRGDISNLSICFVLFKKKKRKCRYLDFEDYQRIVQVAGSPQCFLRIGLSHSLYLALSHTQRESLYVYESILLKKNVQFWYFETRFFFWRDAKRLIRLVARASCPLVVDSVGLLTSKGRCDKRRLREHTKLFSVKLTPMDTVYTVG